MGTQDKLMEVTGKIRHVAETVADLDATRPRYHFHSPAQWGDDPSGFTFYKGYYHMMYGSNPDSYEVGSGMPYRTPNNRWSPEEPEYFDSVALWGHARSLDMVHWEHMPSVCYPDIENDEYFIWWGCTRVNDEGIPVILYTSLGRRRGPVDGAQQRMLVGSDDDLLHWVHYENNPVMTNDIHGDHFIYHWRDPFTFDSGGRTYMVLGGRMEAEDGDCVVLLYEAKNAAFSQWEYRGVFFRYPGDARKSMECPLVARICDRWVLIVSPHGPVEYFVGDIDFDKGEFIWEKRGYVDRGKAFYAPNITFDNKGRCIMFAAVEGFVNTRGWNGVQCVPRELSLTEDGALVQNVPEEYYLLRKECHDLKDEEVLIMNEAVFSVKAGLEPDKAVWIRFCYDDQTVEISYSDGYFTVDGRRLEALQSEGKVGLEIYFDISVMDVLMNGTESLVTIVPSCTGACRVEAGTTDPDGSLTAWQYDVGELFTYYNEEEK